MAGAVQAAVSAANPAGIIGLVFAAIAIALALVVGMWVYNTVKPKLAGIKL